ncbi:cap-specific mRNA (nucleoside-2'-O-)-methyltransferase 2 [Cuculus canorus]|uniref:cap-specific mRNA (nucleoside-2'-O-)-methyltransferase 2 n=1 Tax=Cuculus canorus TaxID=55661 RepID=UPI0023AA6FAC|nr:cap-specific mRNA (nucleoside-2'-O-)-methyltransferase 2 [Cuculus canorus]XP_053934449.1 cap-specific mRNA (nucleoside-2'-O-)-methyltransferase 2 [Cuculus canorus]XP_053934450.1 cap-specific mRNA (nucleoside-2'-O-)-methyltransferase 2 [Cuculus canorus]XP_053934451.1 cap-specific mRNA (nucleoside-2'-O-)-methyltransferase 2 [Cuculus canorus]
MNKGKQPYADQTATLEKFSPDILSEVEKLFAKKFTYTKPVNNEWQLPDPGDAFRYDHREFSSLLALKVSMNEVKNQLSDKNLDAWHQHTSFTNKAGKIIPHVKKAVNAELCTQAWCKFHEILCSFPVLPEQALEAGELSSVHLCEAPGAFIASLNHYLKSHHVTCNWHWVANTLNPYHEANDTLMMIADDRLIANTLSCWYFGPDNTGDVMTLKHLTGLQDFVGDMATVHLVTADGSLDCQGNPGEQEALVSPLLYCETVTALMILGMGGSFVLKMFTLFEHCSTNLLFLLNCSFEEIHVFKPATSKAGNSEAYVICLRYMGRESVHLLLSRMMQNFGTEMVNKALFPQHTLPESFLKIHEECCMFFYECQVETISENIRLFEHMEEAEQTKLNKLRDCAVEFFMERFCMKRIARSNWLVKSQTGCSMNAKWFRQRNKYFSTYNERRLLETLTWNDKLAKGYFNHWAEEHSLNNAGKTCILEQSYSDLECSLWYILEGKRLPVVKCSPFCDGRVLENLNEAMKELGEGSLKSRQMLQTCHSCEVLPGELILAEVADLSRCHQEILNERGSDQFRCLVVNFPSLCDTGSQPGMEIKSLESATLLTFSLSLLYDGEPQYQQQLLECVLHSLHQLTVGDALILPVLSCFTRFTAGLVFILHCCFRCITFACPTSHEPLMTGATLLCVGFQGLPNPIAEYLWHVNKQMCSLLEMDSPQQVLQFVPMEVLLQGKLLAFLWDLNTAIAKRELHLIVQAKQQQQMTSNIAL